MWVNDVMAAGLHNNSIASHIPLMYKLLSRYLHTKTLKLIVYLSNLLDANLKFILFYSGSDISFSLYFMTVLVVIHLFSGIAIVYEN